jgi:hypothetical protein
MSRPTVASASAVLAGDLDLLRRVERRPGADDHVAVHDEPQLLVGPWASRMNGSYTNALARPGPSSRRSTRRTCSPTAFASSSARTRRCPTRSTRSVWWWRRCRRHRQRPRSGVAACSTSQARYCVSGALGARARGAGRVVPAGAGAGRSCGGLSAADVHCVSRLRTRLVSAVQARQRLAGRRVGAGRLRGVSELAPQSRRSSRDGR